MKFEKGNKELGFPEHFQFGIELEANYVNTSKLYHAKESKEFLKSIGYEAKLDDTVDAECVSGILKDSEKTWGNLEKACQHIKKYPSRNGKSVVADGECGGHVHFDATELLQNPKMLENLLHLWVDSEELIYKMCNPENNLLREGTMKKNLIPKIDLKGSTLRTMLSIAKLPLHLAYNIIDRVIYLNLKNGYARPSSQKILKDIRKNKLKVSHKKYNKLQEKFMIEMKSDARRYYGLNLANLRSTKKNTIEFRMSNGSLDPEVIKQNVFLYGSLLNTAREMTYNPEYKKEELALLKRTDCTEEEKSDRLLNVLFDHEEDKRIYKSRWASVKDAPIFAENAKRGFAKNRFVRNDMKQVAEKMPFSKLQDAMMYMKQKVKLKENDKNIGIAYER